MTSLIIDITNYFALAVLTVGLIAAFLGSFRVRDNTFLFGTFLLTAVALLDFFTVGERALEVLAFALLFLLQVISNLLQRSVKNERLITRVVFLLGIALFVLFFVWGLFESITFFLIAVGALVAALGYKEKPHRVVRQSALLFMAALFEVLFAFYTNQFIYIYINIPFLLFGIAVVFRHLLVKRKSKL